jgi:hypothetical protein
MGKNNAWSYRYVAGFERERFGNIASLGAVLR